MAQSQRNKVGELRPSQILFSAGVGSVVDLPNLSTMVMGLDDWDTTHAIELSEERLLAVVKRSLSPSVKRLLSPPLPPESEGFFNGADESQRVGIPVSPFPTWMLCPNCRLLAPLQSRLFELKCDRYRPDQNRYLHTNCPRSKYPPTVVPARFLVACQNGHLDDFPWRYFVHKGKDCGRGSLRLFEYGVSGSAADIEVRCDGDGCGANRRMSDAFGELGKKNMPQCRGRHVHLRHFDEGGCDRQMVGISLGASNSWFPITLSALSIPTSVDKLAQLVEKYWAVLEKAVSIEVLAAFRQIGQLKEFAKYTDAEIWMQVQQRSIAIDGDDDETKDIKTPEWQVFSTADTTLNSTDFRLEPVAPPKGYETVFDKVVLVERLREVRALVGFTRIESPGDFAETGELPEDYQAPLSRQEPKWIPATEVRGEGFFLQLRESVLAQWEALPTGQAYSQQSFEAHQRWRTARSIQDPAANYPGVRYILLHSIAHALMRQLAIECGYTAASLRERIYSKVRDEDNGPMAGILIYTAAPDSEGTLGGLVSLGEPATLGRHLDQALEQMRLCASDPLCAEHSPLQSPNSLHWAACHACLFSPETSCERGNKYLDRTLLIPTVKTELADLAFFKDAV
jgi:hypothetical protein